MASAISFPSGENLLNVIQGYHEEWGFPMCGDAIDGTHVPILAPNESHADCVNSKGYHSIIMQAVVDHNNLYRVVNKTWIGLQIRLRIEQDSGSDRIPDRIGLVSSLLVRNRIGSCAELLF